MTIKNNKNGLEHTIRNKHEVVAKKLAEQIVIQGENKQEFIDFAVKTLQGLQFYTEIEKDLCKKYIFLSWKLRRAIEHERDLLSEQNKSLTTQEEIKISMGRIKGRRVRDISRIDLSDPGVINLTQQQFELEKRINKTLDRIRAEQQRREK